MQRLLFRMPLLAAVLGFWVLLVEAQDQPDTGHAAVSIDEGRVMHALVVVCSGAVAPGRDGRPTSPKGARLLFALAAQ